MLSLLKKVWLPKISLLYLDAIKNRVMKTYKVTKNEYGTICWYNEEDQLHREDGPAYELADGTKKWWLNGQRHREDGPAIEWFDGYKEWYLNGEDLTEEEFNKRTQPHKEMTVAQLEQELGYKIKVVKG